MLTTARRWWPQAALALLLVGYAGVSGRGQFGGGSGGEPTSPGFAGGLGSEKPEDPNRAPRVFFRESMTPEAARTHARLAETIALPFANETPLEEILNYLQSSTLEGEGEDAEYIEFYVDPVGLVEADRTPQSPISINLRAISIARGLDLMLTQLGLDYYVDPEGIVIVTSREEARLREVIDPLPYLLDEVRALREEIRALRLERSGGAPGPATSN